MIFTLSTETGKDAPNALVCFIGSKCATISYVLSAFLNIILETKVINKTWPEFRSLDYIRSI